MATVFKALVLLATVVISGCEYKMVEDPHQLEELGQFTTGLIKQLASDRIGEFKSTLTPAVVLLNADADQLIDDLRKRLPPGSPLEAEFIAHAISERDDHWQANMVIEYEFPDAWAQATFIVVKMDGAYRVDGIHITQTARSANRFKSFTLANLSSTHYLFIALAILVPLLILYTLVLCVLTPMEKWKPLWILAILTGIFGVYLNWDTGDISVYPLSLHLLGTELDASRFAPWVVTCSFPLGALLFLIKRKLILRKATIED